VKHENGDLISDSHNILNAYKNFAQLMNVHYTSDVWQIEAHTAEQLVPASVIWRLKMHCKVEKYKSPGSGQIQAELIQVEGETSVSVFHKHINSI
jgi:hypothetical protein